MRGSVQQINLDFFFVQAKKKSVVSALVFNIKAVWQTIMNAFDFHRYPIYMWLQLGGNLFEKSCIIIMHLRFHMYQSIWF